MIFSFRGKKGGRKSRKDEFLEGSSNLELTIPTHFRCPISLDLMKDPVTLSTGMTYDRESIEKWIDAGNLTCPVTNQVLQNVDQIPNHALRKMIQDWCVQNRAHGIDRIPTPRIPVTGRQVSEFCSKILDATQHRDERKIQELIGKIKVLARESERNKKCIAENGAGSAFAAAFESFSSISMAKYTNLLKIILSNLTWMFPLSNQGLSNLGSLPSLLCMAWFLNGEDLSARQNALIVLKELLFSDQSFVKGLIQIEGIVETIFKTFQMPFNSTATKASLAVIYYMMASNEKVIKRFVDMGLAPLVVEILVDGERSICEKALGVLDIICDCAEGEEGPARNALTVPVLVKKLLRVSDIATQFIVSILWRLLKGGDEDLIIEALQVGAFQKILVVLQVGCGQSTKEKATDLLKLMNLYKDKVECIDSASGFKYLKRSN